MLTIVKLRKIVPDRTNTYYKDEKATLRRWAYQFLRNAGVLRPNLSHYTHEGFDEERQAPYIEYFSYFCDQRNFLCRASKDLYSKGKKIKSLTLKQIKEYAKKVDMEVKELTIWFK